MNSGCDPPLLGPLVLLRHGTSQANRDGRTAGWEDVDLVPEGVADSHRAARALMSAHLTPDTVHASMLLRARRTAEIVVQAAGLSSSSMSETWRLNERHAGAFEGLTREEMVEHFGREAVRSWRHSVDVRPAQLDESDGRHPRHDPRYRNVARELLPTGEASTDVLDRVLPLLGICCARRSPSWKESAGRHSRARNPGPDVASPRSQRGQPSPRRSPERSAVASLVESWRGPHRECGVTTGTDGFGHRGGAGSTSR